jgi:hypothetical protein
MRRIKLIVAALAVVVAALAGVSGPAMADDLDCHNRPGPFIRCDGDRFVNVDRLHAFNNNDVCRFFDCFGFNGFTRLDNDFGSCWEWSWVFDRWEWDCD